MAQHCWVGTGDESGGGGGAFIRYGGVSGGGFDGARLEMVVRR